MVAVSFLSTLFLSLAVAAKSVERAESFTTLPLTRRVSADRNNIVNLDRLRVNYIMGYDIFDDVISTSAEQINATAYIAAIGVGCPPTTYNLLIDTGSSNTWVGGDKPYVMTSTSHRTNDSVSARYGQGSFIGTEYIDEVTIAPGLEIMQSIGVASSADHFDGLDGILGLGPVNLTNNTLSPDKHSVIPTVLNNLYAEGKIAKEVLGVFFEPDTNTTLNAIQKNGELTWGGFDYSKFIGDINYTPIPTTYPASNYWSIGASLSYGEDTTLLSSKYGVVDTGSTQILLSTEAFQAYQNATGAVTDPDNGLQKITSAQYENLESIYLKVDGISEPFELTPNAQIFARSQNTGTGLNGTADAIYLVVNDLGLNSSSSDGLEFILGLTFLERFYSVYDRSESRVGLAMTRFTYADTN